MPKRRAASRWLSPSTWQAWRTRPYSSTENIPAFPGSFRTSLRTAMSRYAFVPPRPDYPAASVAYLSSAALTQRRNDAQHPPEPVFRLRLQRAWRAGCGWAALSGLRPPLEPGHRRGGDGAQLG